MAGFSDLVSSQAESLLEQDLYLRAGATWNVTWELRDADDALVDFTGCTASGAVWTNVDGKPGTAVAVWTNTSTAGRQIVLSNGYIAFTASNVSTNALFPNEFEGFYEVKVTSGVRVVSVASGRLVVRKNLANG